ncbi:MAG: TolC family protein [Myxococcota bacterium]
MNICYRTCICAAVVLGLSAVVSPSSAQDTPDAVEPGAEESAAQEDAAAADAEDAEQEDSLQGGQMSDPNDGGRAAGGDADEDESSPAQEDESASGQMDEESATSADAPVEDAPTATRYQLSELLVRTKNNSDLLAEFEAKREKAEWQQFRAKWAWAPKIEATSFLAPVPADADPDQIQNNVDEIGDLEIGPFFNQDLRVVSPLYTFGKISTARELAVLGLDANELERKKARLDLLFKIKQAYYGLQLSTSFTEILEEGDKRIEKQLEEMDTARDFGEADFEIEDFRKLEIFSAEVDTRIVDNKKLAKVAKAGIRYLAEIETDEDIVVGSLEEKDDPPKLEDLSYYLKTARKNRPEMQQLRTAVEARRLEVQLQRTQWYPDVFAAVTFGFGWSTEDVKRQEICISDADSRCIDEEEPRLTAEPYRNPFDRLSVGFGVGLRWKIDPMQQTGKYNEKQAQLEALLAQKRRATGAIDLEVRKLYQDAADSLEKIAINKRRLEAARRWRDQLGISIETAGAEMEDAIEPLKAFYQAKALYLETRFNYMVARARLAKSVGALRLGEDGEVLESLAP